MEDEVGQDATAFLSTPTPPDSLPSQSLLNQGVSMDTSSVAFQGEVF